VNGFWSATGAAQQVLIATSSALNASYFIRRAFGTPEGRQPSLGRRLAAAALALLFAAIAVEAAAGIPVASTGFEVARRMPLLLATLTVAWLVGFTPRARRTPRGDVR